MKKNKHPLQRIGAPVIGQHYHLSFRNNGCVWILKSINADGTCELQTPKTKHTIYARVKDLRLTRASQYKRKLENK